MQVYVRDCAVTGKTIRLDQAETGKCLTAEDLMSAVLGLLQIPVSTIAAHLELAGKTLASEGPLDFGKTANTGLVMLTLAPGGLVGGSLSPRADVDDDFKRVAAEDQQVGSPKKK